MPASGFQFGCFVLIFISGSIGFRHTTGGSVRCSISVGEFDRRTRSKWATLHDGRRERVLWQISKPKRCRKSVGMQQEGSVSYAGCLRTGSYIFYSVFFALIVFIFSLTCAHCRRPGWLSPRDVDMRRDSKICNICLARCVNPLSRFGSTSGRRVFDMLSFRHAVG
jgi:hypothetical protein